MKYQKYPAQTIKVAGDLRRAPATFENPELKCQQMPKWMTEHQRDWALAGLSFSQNLRACRAYLMPFI